MKKNNIENNRINVITLADYSQYINGKHRNGGAYGYDVIYTYNPDKNSFTREWTTTCELTSEEEPVDGFSLDAAISELAEFVSRFADAPNCTVYINGICVWESIGVDSHDIDNSNLYLDE